MLNVNEFKKRIKKWMDDNPFAQETDLVKYCKKIIPENELKANQWLLDQTVSWYKHILLIRDKNNIADHRYDK